MFTDSPTHPTRTTVFGPSSMKPIGVLYSLIFPLIFVTAVASWVGARWYARRARLLDEGASSSEIRAKKQASFGMAQASPVGSGLSNFGKAFRAKYASVVYAQMDALKGGDQGWDN